MSQKQKLELTWIGKENRPRLEPRILLEDPEKSYHAAERLTEKDSFDNRLIFGDNLLALKALEQEFTGKVKCVYIDPPFNTGQAMEHYEDGLEHSIWLTLMRERLRLLHRLLTRDGSLFVHIDDNELGYLLVLLDEIFGRNNRQYVVTFKQGSATGHKAINPGCVSTTNFVLIYSKDKPCWKPNRVFTGRDRDKRYGQFIANRSAPHDDWEFTTVTQAFAASINMTTAAAKKLPEYEQKLTNFVLANASSVVQMARPSYDDVSAEAREMIDTSKRQPNRVLLLTRENNPDMYFLGGQRILFYSSKVKFIDGVPTSGEPLTTLWEDILSNNLHKEGGIDFPKGKKPESLIKRVLDLATRPGDLVLDSFAGSGTTGAVAHKMGRRWIMVELGEHCHTHIVPRLKKVIDGQDPGGITQALDWKGGGGFRYYRLAPSLLEKDAYGNPVINKKYNAAMLSEAMCKHFGFRYEPSESVYWQQGRSTEDDFLYTTTQTLSAAQLRQLSEEVGPERSLMICGMAFRGKSNEFPNLELRKIPAAVLKRCEWGKDDYSLTVENLPMASPTAPDGFGTQSMLFQEEAQ